MGVPFKFVCKGTTNFSIVQHFAAKNALFQSFQYFKERCLISGKYGVIDMNKTIVQNNKLFLLTN